MWPGAPRLRCVRYALTRRAPSAPMGLPGMRGGGEPPNPPPLSAAARALREAETAGTFEQNMIFLANAAAVFLVVVVLLCTLLGALPDKDSAAQRRKKGAAAAAAAAKDGRYTAADVAKHAAAVSPVRAGQAGGALRCCGARLRCRDAAAGAPVSGCALAARTPRALYRRGAALTARCGRLAGRLVDHHQGQGV